MTTTMFFFPKDLIPNFNPKSLYFLIKYVLGFKKNSKAIYNKNKSNDIFNNSNAISSRNYLNKPGRYKFFFSPKVIRCLFLIILYRLIHTFIFRFFGSKSIKNIYINNIIKKNFQKLRFKYPKKSKKKKLFNILLKFLFYFFVAYIISEIIHKIKHPIFRFINFLVIFHLKNYDFSNSFNKIW